MAGAFVPLNFIAVRLAETLVHPRVFATSEGGLPPKMWVAFLVCLAGMALLWQTLVSFELAAKSSRASLGRLRRALEGDDAAVGALADRAGAAGRAGGRALMPALPLDEAGKYVAGAYVVFVALLLIYVAIMAVRLSRIDRELAELAELAERPRPPSPRTIGSGFPHERAPGARRLAQDRAARAARAHGADRGPRGRGARRAGRPRGDPRGSGDLDLQPDRALSLRRRPGRGRGASRSGCSRARPRPSRPSWSAASTRCAATAAAEQLLRVTAGLDSMIIGEAEVQGQVKRAYELALVEGATGPILNRLFRGALAAGKRARSETGISERSLSIPSVAVELAQRTLGRAREPRACWSSARARPRS